MKKKSKKSCLSTSKCNCNSCEQTKACKSSKKCTKKYIDCHCEDYEITCVDKCVNLAKEAEELFEKALEHECKAVESYEQAQKHEKAAKTMNTKAKHLAQKASCDEKESKMAKCKAEELMIKSQELCEQAKCLYKEVESIEQEAECHCEKAKCLYKQSQEHNEKAKVLYQKALKCDEKALQCYKIAGEKIKEYETKSKKCEDMMKKCNDKLDMCSKKHMDTMDDCNCYIEEEYLCMPTKHKKYYNIEKTYCNPCHNEGIMYIDEDDLCIEHGCPMYISPMYDMYNMHNMSGFNDQYPCLDMPYMQPYIEQYQDINDMWMNYYNMMQNMMMSPREYK